MVTPNTNTAQTWRDLIDQLTPEQVATLEKFERTTLGHTDADVASDLLEAAREHATANVINNAQSWRDLADQLPPHVVQRFERQERMTELHGPLAFPQEDPAEVVRRGQELMLREAREQIPFAHVPLPAAARTAYLWEDSVDGTWTRVVDGTRRTVGPLSVCISGVQSPDGSVVWSVAAETKDDAVTTEQLREYAALLIEAADELDDLNRARPVH